MISFEAEVTEVRAKKLVSLDKEYRITLVTNEEKALELEQFIANSTIQVKIEEAKE